MRDRSYRRKQKKRIINKCKEMLKHSNFQGGTLYEKHVKKIEENGFGYMSKHGTKIHYIHGNKYTHGKVRDRNSWSGTNNWNIKDIRQFNSMNGDMFDE